MWQKGAWQNTDLKVSLLWKGEVKRISNVFVQFGHFNLDGPPNKILFSVPGCIEKEEHVHFDGHKILESNRRKLLKLCSYCCA